MKKIVFFIHLILISRVGYSQKAKPTFLNFNKDTIGFEEFYSYTINGEYKVKHNTKTRTRTLVPWQEGELEIELENTRKKTVKTVKLGDHFPEIKVKDINENLFNTKLYSGKIIVVNFWFIGCVPCEFERRTLNAIYNEYKDNPNVVFISFAKSKKAQLQKYLEKRPFLYPIVELNDKLISLLDVYSYPQNQIIGKDGKYVFNSHSAGTGNGIIIKEAIDKALGSQ